MSGKELSQPHQEGFDFTENERLFYQVSHERFRAIFDDEQTHIHRIELSHNSYGEFLFITTSRATEVDKQPVTFYSQGYHEHRERWIRREWFWYETNRHPATTARIIPKDEAREILNQREEEVARYATEDSQSERGQLFEMLADITDDDAALTEMEDLEDWLSDDFGDSQ